MCRVVDKHDSLTKRRFLSLNRMKSSNIQILLKLATDAATVGDPVKVPATTCSHMPACHYYMMASGTSIYSS